MAKNSTATSIKHGLEKWDDVRGVIVYKNYPQKKVEVIVMLEHQITWQGTLYKDVSKFLESAIPPRWTYTIQHKR